MKNPSHIALMATVYYNVPSDPNKVAMNCSHLSTSIMALLQAITSKSRIHILLTTSLYDVEVTHKKYVRYPGSSLLRETSYETRILVGFFTQKTVTAVGSIDMGAS